MIIAIGSENPVKISAVTLAFQNYFLCQEEDCEIIAEAVDSSVARQPLDHQVFKGAENRVTKMVEKLSQQGKTVEYYVAIESGLIELYKRYFNVDVACLKQESGSFEFGMSPGFILPESLNREMLQGKELGDIMYRISGVKNIKQAGGAISYFSRNITNRQQQCYTAVMMALITNQETFMGHKIPFYIDYLSQLFAKKVAINSSYSLRAFAGFLEVDASYLSKCLAKKQSMSLQVAERILAKLSVEESVRKQFMQSIVDFQSCSSLKKHDDSLTDCSD